MEYLFLMSRLLQNSLKALLLNYNPLSDTRDSGTLNLVTMFLHINFLTSIPDISQCLRLCPFSEVIHSTKTNL